jgi:cytochrome c oxidase accessory protein FixG
MSEQIPVKIIDPSEGSQNKKTNKQHQGTYTASDKIYVKEITGFFQRLRSFVLWIPMGLYFITPWIYIQGEPMVYFDLPARKFHLLGITFWPQDFILLTGLLIIAAYTLFFVTTLYGRLWCGYSCPQTVWTFIFMWIEERIEGSRNQRIKLDNAPFSRHKLWKKTAKHSLWLLVAFATGFTFVGYFYPVHELSVDLFTFHIQDNWAYFWIGFFTVATYLNAGWVREQVCLYMCPYARFQSVMYDENTIAVSYDPTRGEPRGSRKRNLEKTADLGDCVDCGMCVQVCPTGIDIRDGLQYECIGCGLCIDACDQIMEKMNYPKGLIRYTSENALEGKPAHFIRPKSVGYGVALLLLFGAVGYTLATRKPILVDIIKDRGGLYQMTGMGQIENNYTLKIMNMSNKDETFHVTVKGLKGIHISTNPEIFIKSSEIYSLPVSVDVPPESLKVTNTTIEFEVKAKSDPSISKEAESRFLGPVSDD